MSGIAYNPNIHIPFYIPNLVAGILYCILLIWGLIVGIYYKQWWFTVTFSIGSLIETLGYVGRALGSGDSATYDTGYYTWQLVCLAIAPVFYLAGIYYLLPKLAVVYGTSSSFSSSSRISRLLAPPVRYLYILLGFDVVSLALLCAGTGYKGSNSEFEETAGRGTGIIIAGFGVQLGGMLVFGILGADVLIRFNKKQKHQNHHSTNSVGVNDDEEDGWLTANRFEQQQQDMMVYDEYESIYDDHRSLHITLLWSIFAATVLIFIRTVFRIIEVSVSKVRSHEAYLLVFDGLLVLIAGFILTVIGHPGRVFDKYSKIPIFKK